ncbi:hypothetical protein BP00DRAFT_422472 [Aspergillus indologenus CBS 114.80]|uniref:Protein kinase domain-containing protein n=1 Tax=Aspergillus indologenus CBS 114.80 TaxID=1450541 RepID=A0A2V5IGB1_9EURO|nr:hypothetical protein BP00DRAFT_422472 [Aspergillus indologenus CBS 114.80]
MTSPYLDLRGDPIPREQMLGCGSSAVVLLQAGAAVKIPLRYRWSADSDVEVNLSSLRREQGIYCCLHSNPDDRCSVIVGCLKVSAASTQLAYIVNGDLWAYLAKRRPSQELQLTWFREMARPLCYIHDSRVLVADIAAEQRGPVARLDRRGLLGRGIPQRAQPPASVGFGRFTASLFGRSAVYAGSLPSCCEYQGVCERSANRDCH